ncbi:MAG: DoxX family protein [Pseudomonadota bacterium]
MTLQRGADVGLRALLTLIFVAAGGAKLLGVSMMVDIFETIGWGQWFRYVTALVELGAAALLWVPGLNVLGAALLLATMLCGALFHLLILGPSAVPALILAAFCAAVIYVQRAQIEPLAARFMARS